MKAFSPCLRVLLLTLVILSSTAMAKRARFPEPVGYVNDFAKVVDAETERKISDICYELEEKTSAQIAVATFPDMDGGEIDDFTSRLFEQWKPGQQGKDNGVLIVDAIEERRVRIEIGYGLEPVITDGMAGRIRRDLMTPLLKEGHRGKAYLVGVVELAGLIADASGTTLAAVDTSGITRLMPHLCAAPGHVDGIGMFTLLMIIFIPILIAIFGLAWWQGWSGSYSDHSSGGFSGGGGGGFGGFGGGASGGGGSSGGY